MTVPDRPISSSNEEILTYLKRLTASRFWGSVTFKFESGEVVHVRQEENFKPFELSGRPRTKHGNESNQTR